jgi:hypothetical protein
VAGGIAGGVIGGVLVLALLSFCAWQFAAQMRAAENARALEGKPAPAADDLDAAYPSEALDVAAVDIEPKSGVSLRAPGAAALRVRV